MSTDEKELEILIGRIYESEMMPGHLIMSSGWTRIPHTTKDKVDVIAAMSLLGVEAYIIRRGEEDVYISPKVLEYRKRRADEFAARIKESKAQIAEMNDFPHLLVSENAMYGVKVTATKLEATLGMNGGVRSGLRCVFEVGGEEHKVWGYVVFTKNGNFRRANIKKEWTHILERMGINREQQGPEFWRSMEHALKVVNKATKEVGAKWGFKWGLNDA